MLSIVVVYYDKDEHFMKTLLRSLPTWAEWVFIKTVKGGENTEVRKDKNIIRGYYNYEGDFNFMEAKNYAKKFATKEWILFLDADEHLDILQHDFIKEVIENASEEVGGFYCTQYSWLQGQVDSEGVSERLAIGTVRLVRNLPPINYRFPIHEVLDLSVLESGYSLQDTNIRILHDGWVLPKEKLIERLERNLQAIWKHPELAEMQRYKDYIINTAVNIKHLKGL